MQAHNCLIYTTNYYTKSINNNFHTLRVLNLLQLLQQPSSAHKLLLKHLEWIALLAHHRLNQLCSLPLPWFTGLICHQRMVVILW